MSLHPQRTSNISLHYVKQKRNATKASSQMEAFAVVPTVDCWGRELMRWEPDQPMHWISFASANGEEIHQARSSC